ncbi:transferase, transferring glycosyl groups, partial [Genlisea aurea]
QLKVLVGVFTTPDRYESRSFLRLVYGAQSPTGAIIDVRFIMCRMADAEHKITVGLEIMNYGDMIILDCRENMNDGKTYTYFSSLPRLFESNSTNPPYHYVVKADDDVYIRLQPLVESLQFVAREDAYYGCNATQRGVEYMIGSLYAVSWDITEWLSISHIPNFSGPQDILFATWLRDGHVGKNRYDIEDKLYDIQVAGTHFAH